MKKTSLLLLLIILTLHPYCHPIKVSTASLEIKGAITIKLNVFWDDFNDHIMSNYRTQLNVKEVNPATSAILNDYIKKQLIIFQDGNKYFFKVTQYALLEEENILQIQGVVEGVDTSRSFRITDTLLFDAFDNQSNILYYFNQGKKTPYQFNKDQTSVIISP